MVRKLALAVSLALGTLSVPAHALGLGELSSKSALNQNFKGDIKLLSVRAEELDAVRVGLADAEAFKRAGVDRPFYLSLLKFEPVLTDSGKSVVRVSSDFPIREPFMNFLVEVNWPNGRLLREYTVLLDPPTTTKRRPPKVTPAATSTRSTPAKAAVAKTATPSTPATTAKTTSAGVDGYEYGPVVANDTAWGISKKVRPSGVSMEQMMMALLEANPHAFIDGNINRLRKGKILRVPALAEIQKLSYQQARQAYREQQDQWLAQRDERLRKAAAVEQAEAQATEGGGAEVTSDDQLRIATARPEGEGEAGAGDDDAVSPTSTDLKSRLIVARENAETSRQEAEVLRSQVDDLQVRLEDMQKLLTLKDDQLAQLQDRVVTEELEAEAPLVADAPAEDVVVAEAGTEPVEAAADAGVSPDVTEDYRIQDVAPQVDPDAIVMESIREAAPIEELAPQLDADQVAQEAAEAAEVVVSEESGEAQGTQAEVVIEETPAGQAESEAAEPLSEAVVEEQAAPEPVTAAVVEPPPVAEPVAEPPVSESARPSPWYSVIEKNMLPIGAGGVSLLALLGWLATRGRRKEEEPAAPEPALAAVADAGTEEPGHASEVAEVAEATVDPESAMVDEPAVTAEALNDLPDSSFLEEFSPADINALQDETGEVDPVSEADVYIAYGRYQQAEEMLNQAMSRDPDRLALKHKLLEVHYATKNAGAFAVLAQQMVDAGQDAADDAAWSRAMDMGRELAPDNELFDLAGAGRTAALDEDVPGDAVTAAAVAAAAEGAANAVDADTMALDDLDLSELTAEFEAEAAPEEGLGPASEVSVTLDLDDSTGLNEAGGIELPEPIQLSDIEGLDVELPKAEPEGIAGGVDETVADSLDLDGMMAEAEAAVDGGDSLLNADSEFSADELQAQLDELSDLSILDSELDAASTSEMIEPLPSIELESEDVVTDDESQVDQPFNLDEAFDVAESEDGGEDVLEMGEVAAVPESVDEDEVATKLDLARAYVEMGDEDGARAILAEVAAEGSQAQRGDAETLLSQLG